MPLRLKPSSCSQRVIIEPISTQGKPVGGRFEVEPGSYLVKFTAPEAHGFVQPHQGADAASDSDVVGVETSVNEARSIGIPGSMARAIRRPNCILGTISNPVNPTATTETPP